MTNADLFLAPLSSRPFVSNLLAEENARAGIHRPPRHYKTNSAWCGPSNRMELAPDNFSIGHFSDRLRDLAYGSFLSSVESANRERMKDIRLDPISGDPLRHYAIHGLNLRETKRNPGAAIHQDSRSDEPEHLQLLSHSASVSPSLPTIAPESPDAALHSFMLLDRAKRALSDQNVSEAIRILKAGVDRFPKDEQIEQLLRTILPTGATRTIEETTTGRREEMLWLKRNGTRYRGKWVALSGNRLLAAESSLSALLASVKESQNKGDEKLTPLIQHISSDHIGRC